MEGMKAHLPVRLWRIVYPKLIEPIALGTATTATGVSSVASFPFERRSIEESLTEDADALRSDVRISVRKTCNLLDQE